MPTNINLPYIDLFDIVGPIMIGPSSSHTAGAAKIGQAAYELLGEEPTKVRIKLFNSFSDTGQGHKTDIAILGGCIGLEADDEQLLFSEKIAQENKVDYKIKWGFHSPDLHPNTAIIDLEGKNYKAALVGYSIGGGVVTIAKKHRSNINDKKQSDADDLSSSLTNKKTNKKNKTYFTFAELASQASTAKQLLKLILTIQESAFDQPQNEILDEFEKRWLVMVRSILKGVSSYQRAESNMYGGDAYRIRRSKLNLLNQEIENGIFYSIGVAEHNAKMGKIVAAPTAGSAGIIPGLLKSMQEKFAFSDREIAKALTVSAGVGAVMASQVELAGAVGGCQAEIGAAGAMAAAAGTYLLDGRVEAIESAASLVLANLLGLTCDPVMGLVEVPCILRNGMIASMVFAAIEIALDGVRYTIPFDEVVQVMKNVGDDMHQAYKETSQGGLAQTQTAKNLCRGCSRCG